MNPQEQEPLRIRQIRIDGLFGLYNHCINLNLKERVTILHGPNGVGKTITLKMIENLFEKLVEALGGTNNIFWKIPFNLFFVEFTDGSSIKLLATEKGNQEFDFKLITNDGSQHNTILTKQGSDFTFDYDLWFTENNLKTHFIGVDRLNSAHSKKHKPIGLIATKQNGISSTITNYSKDLVEIIESTLASYARESQVLDQSFPQRLMLASSTDGTNIKSRLSSLDRQRLELQEIGLLDQVDTPFFDSANLDELISKEKKVMILYVEDTERKLAVFEGFARRIKLLLNNINTKFKNKHLRIDREKGFIVISDSGQILDLDLLSSGEQHEIVLFYDLLFRIKPNTLVLIDEPELSLHVSWQDHFLPDLLKIVEIAHFDVLIATHSPYIVGDYIDLMVALETGTI